jgi:hypothetical protein
MSGVAYILLRLASMPLCETRYPRPFPLQTPKMHLFGFKRSLDSRIVANVSTRSARWSSFFLLMSDDD